MGDDSSVTTRRRFLAAVAAVGGGAFLTGRASAQASTSDNNGDIGTPSNRVDLFADDVDTNVIDIQGSRFHPYGPVPAWSKTRHPNNPLIDGTSYDGQQFYAPRVIHDPADGNYYVTGKSGGPDRIFGFQSSDGITWSNETELLAPGGENANNGMFFKDADTGTYHIYTNHQPSAGANYEIRHYTASGPLGNYSADANNPIYTISDLESDLGWANTPGADGINFSDMIVLNGEHIFYGYTYSTGDAPWQLFCATGSDYDDITGRNILLDSIDFYQGGEAFQTPHVMQTQGTFFGIFTAGIDDSVNDHRQIYGMVGGPYRFTPLAEPVQTLANAATWEEARNYAGHFVVNQQPDRNGNKYTTPTVIDGKVRNYYAGKPETNGSGIMGLAEYDWPLRNVGGAADAVTPQRTRAKRYPGSNKTLDDSTSTALPLDGVVDDAHGFVTADGNGDDAYQVEKSGTYHIQASVRFGVDDGSKVYAFIDLNGFHVAQNDETAAAVDIVKVSEDVELTRGDQLQLLGRQDTGGTADVINGSDQTYITIDLTNAHD